LAGSGVVHMSAGFFGLIGTIIVGPRMRRFEQINSHEDEVIVG